MVASSSFVTSSQKDPLITGSVLLLLYFGVTSSSFDTFAQKDPLIACSVLLLLCFLGVVLVLVLASCMQRYRNVLR